MRRSRPIEFALALVIVGLALQLGLVPEWIVEAVIEIGGRGYCEGSETVDELGGWISGE